MSFSRKTLYIEIRRAAFHMSNKNLCFLDYWIYTHFTETTDFLEKSTRSSYYSTNFSKMVFIFICIALVMPTGGAATNMTHFKILNDTNQDEMIITTMGITFDLYDDIPRSVERLMHSNETLEFLGTFSAGFQRELVYQQLMNCPLTRLCGYRFHLRIPYFEESCCAECSCDFPACLLLESCCLDILLKFTHVDFRPNFNIQCIPVNVPSREERGALMIASCPAGVNEDINTNCTREYTSELHYYKDIVPVTNIMSSDVYRNAHCALCNGVDEQYLNKAGVVLTCDQKATLNTEHDTILATLDAKTCSMAFTLSSYKDCKLSVSECNITGLWKRHVAYVEEACMLYRSDILINGTYYKNVFCAMCNGISVDAYTCDGPRYAGEPFSFSGLLKLESNKAQADDMNKENDCSEDQLFDYVFGICRAILCSPLMNLQKGQCKETYSEIENPIYIMYLRIKPLEARSLMEGYFAADQLINYLYSLPLLENSVCGIQLLYHIKEGNFSDDSAIMTNASLSFYKARVQIYQQFRHNPYKLYNRLSMLHKSNHSIHYFDYNAKQMHIFKAEFELLEYSPVLFEDLSHQSNELNGELIFDKGDAFPLPFNTLIAEHSYESNHSGVDIFHLRYNDFIRKCNTLSKRSFVVSVMHLKSCPKVRLYKHQVPWKQTDDGIELTETNTFLDNMEFYYNGSDSIIVCVEVYKQYMLKLRPPKDDTFSTMVIVSIVSSIISIVSLLLTFVVFVVIPKLRRNLPGKNNVSLVLVLMCAQCLYLISVMGGIKAGTEECVAIGVLLHFSWLLSLLWMNVCTYHMFHVLTRNKVMSSKSGNYRLVAYHFYATIMAIIPVVVNVTVQWFTSGSYGYGDDACYISSQKMVAYTFGIPAAVIILSNLCMYFIVIYKINKSPSVQKNVKHERNNFLIFIKLSTITGATWIFGFISSWTDVIFLSYLFILLNASQGLFIMFAFVLNRRVINMFRSDILGQDITVTDTDTRTAKTSIRPNRSL